MSEAVPRHGSIAKLLSDADTQRKLVAEANLAPSLYNTQPARWRFLPDGSVLLFEDLRRRLRVADADGRHARQALGAAFEGMALVLSKSGLGLELLQLAPAGDDGLAELPHLRLTAGALITQAGGRDPLAGYVRERHTFRGVFEPVAADVRDALGALLHHFGDVIPATETADIDAIAAHKLQCRNELMQRHGYRAELYRWMSWSPRQAQKRYDGLTIKDMALANLPRVAKPLLLRSGVLATLDSLGVAPNLFDEAKSIRSAAAVGLLTVARAEDPFVAGRRMYRIWLELTRAGYALCPMSALTDTACGVWAMRQRFQVARERDIASVFRIGKVAAGTVFRRKRLAARELLV
jgi:hypothetical protein